MPICNYPYSEACKRDIEYLLSCGKQAWEFTQADAGVYFNPIRAVKREQKPWWGNVFTSQLSNGKSSIKFKTFGDHYVADEHLYLGISARNLSDLNGQFIGRYNDGWSIDLASGYLWNNLHYNPICRPVANNETVEI